jgi:hypothetical protein
MGQAKRRGTLEERIVQANQRRQDTAKELGYIPNSIAKFQPDAGVNSVPDATNHYWFQTAEFASMMLRRLPAKRYEHLNQPVVEINFKVDIMDEAGDKHLIPHPENGEGFALTMRFTAPQLNQLADAVDKGGMSVRLSGLPAELNTSTAGEQFRLVDCADVYSKGNLSGVMRFMVNVNGTMMSTSSTDLAASIRKVAVELG